MSANIYNDGEKDCMFVVGTRTDAWHLLGQRAQQAQTAAQAIELAGLDYLVAKVPNYAMVPGGKKAIEVPSCTVFNCKTGVAIGTVNPTFEIKQNKECFDYTDCLVEANGGAHYDSAGALGNGAKIWIAVRVPKADFAINGGDKHESYLVFATAHDGSIAHTVKLTTVRVVCQNTLNSALSGSGAMFKVKHTKNANLRLDRAKHLMQGVVMDAHKLEEKLKALASRKMTRETMVAVLNRLFPAPVEENASTTRRENVLIEVMNLYAGNDNNAFPDIKGTAYNLLNSVTEYTDHFRNARMTDNRQGMTVAQARAENAVMGTGDKLKNSALAVIDEETERTSIVKPPDALLDPMSDSQFLKLLKIKL